MSLRHNEPIWLASSLVSGTYVAWYFTEQLSLHHRSSNLTSYSQFANAWLAIPLVPLLIFSYSNWTYLRKSRLHGCLPGKVYPHRDPILGIDWLLDVVRGIKEHNLLEKWCQIFDEFGDTFWNLNMGSWSVMTNDPENVKAVLSTNFDDWPLLGVRQQVVLLALGKHAIFSVNGQEWHSQRAMIRPSFNRNQLADLVCTDRHVDHFLDKVTKNGGEVNLQDIFFEFMMDVSSDFM